MISYGWSSFPWSSVSPGDRNGLGLNIWGYDKMRLVKIFWCEKVLSTACCAIGSFRTFYSHQCKKWPFLYDRYLAAWYGNKGTFLFHVQTLLLGSLLWREFEIPTAPDRSLPSTSSLVMLHSLKLYNSKTSWISWSQRETRSGFLFGAKRPIFRVNVHLVLGRLRFRVIHLDLFP